MTFGITVTQTDEIPPNLSWTDYFIPILLEDIISWIFVFGINVVCDGDLLVEDVVNTLEEIAENIVNQQIKDYEKIDILTCLSDKC